VAAFVMLQIVTERQEGLRLAARDESNHFPGPQALPVNIPSTYCLALSESCWTSHRNAVPAYVDNKHYIMIKKYSRARNLRVFMKS
jgi:hypothetical protein